MANIQLGNKAVGSIVKLKVNSVARNFIVVHQGKPSSIYDESCNGTWLLMEDIYENRQWHSSNVNDYANSEIHGHLNNTFINLFENNIKNAIKQVKIPYRPGSGTSSTINSGASGLSAKIFLLSGYELGWTNSDSEYFPADGAKVSYFISGSGTDANNKRIAYLSGGAASWWLRSPYMGDSTYAWYVNTNGSYGSGSASNARGVRPALVLPSSLLVSEDGSISTNTAPTTPASINVPEQVNGGGSINISWAGSTDAEGNLAGYKVERSIDGGSVWTQIYQSTNTSCTDNITFGWETVQYRVKAYDSGGLESGWRVSAQREVFNNTAPNAPPSITVPLNITGGESIIITWNSSTDAEDNHAGYRLEHSVANGAWKQIYQGAALFHEDAITKGWTTVAYRVCAYDNDDATSGYTVSPTRTVDNNTAPEIVSDSSGELGEKTAGFSIEYIVNDVDGDTATVTESIDGAEKRTFLPVLGSANTFEVTGEYFMSVLNGQHIMTIKATDAGGKSTTLNLTFEKKVHRARIWSTEPMETDGLITKTVLSVVRSIPDDATFTVLLSNNAKDAEAVWEDATSAVIAGVNYLFDNTEVSNGHAYALDIRVERGPSGQGGYIESIGGAFE